MQIEHQFPCSAVQFFNFMARRIAQDIQIETDKKLTIAEIHQGMKYDKKVLLPRSGAFTSTCLLCHK